MTIIAGFPVTGFIVLGADGEEGGFIEKAAVRKIAVIQHQEYVSVIGGAGHGDFIDLAVQQMRESLNAAEITITMELLRTTLEEVVAGIYDERIDYLPAIEQEAAKFTLLCALWTKESGRAQLVNVGRRYSLIRTRPDVAGMGSYLARYLIETLQIDNLQRRHAERLCAYILAKAKAHVKDCGGASQIIVLSDAGEIAEVPQYVISEDEESTTMLMEKVRPLFHWSDMIGWQGDVEQVSKVIDDIANLIKRDIRIRVARRQAAEAAEAQVWQSDQKLPTDDPKDRPPSQA